MGHREVRPVPLDWEHPAEGTYPDGKPRYIGLHSRADLRWSITYYDEHPEYADEWEYDPADYMPEIPEGTPYGFQLYETTSEGTPVSPVFGTLEELAQWCEAGATVFADHRWTAEQWHASFKADSLGSDSLMVIDKDGIHPLGGSDD